MTGDYGENGPRRPAQDSRSDGRNGRSLPPPVFPPGAGERAAAGDAVEGDAMEGDAMSSAFISPDDPMPGRRENVPGEASVHLESSGSPKGSAPTAVVTDAVDDDFEEGVVTDMGDDPHLDPEELALGFDPHVREVVEKVGKLAGELKQHGEAGLRTTREMSRFDATLRAYCVGYLAGRRAEEEEG